jgi:hypothetical protein
VNLAAGQALRGRPVINYTGDGDALLKRRHKYILCLAVPFILSHTGTQEIVHWYGTAIARLHKLAHIRFSLVSPWFGPGSLHDKNDFLSTKYRHRNFSFATTAFQTYSDDCISHQVYDPGPGMPVPVGTVEVRTSNVAYPPYRWATMTYTLYDVILTSTTTYCFRKLIASFLRKTFG